jgi:uncharacterized protein YukJ
MPIQNYGLLTGRPISGGLAYPQNRHNPPHYKIRVQAGSAVYEVAVNVQSRDQSQVLYYIDFAFQPPDLTGLLALSPGRIDLASEPGGLALDFLRQKLVTREQMHLLPLPSQGHGGQLLGAVQMVTDAAQQDPGAVLYAFGSNYTDGIHDIHMNQGNPPGNHDEDNGAWQDGALLLYLPAQHRWVGIFLAFQTQSWTTDASGNAADTLEEVAAAPALPAAAPGAAPAEMPRYVPRRFAAERPTLKKPEASRPQDHGNQRFYPLPKPTRPAPYRMDLAEVLPPEQMRRVTDGKRLVFHLVGDTGNAGNDRMPQEFVARHMERQLHAANAVDVPAFFYILGDVVYFHGEESQYGSQFFDIYDFYRAPIFAIPGNHDGDGGPGAAPTASLAAFVKHFCAPRPDHPPAAHEAVRDAMTQPNPYWTLTTPLLTIIGLYTNVPEHGLLDDPASEKHPQEEWFRQELAQAPTDRPVLVALHHPPYSLDNGHGGSTVMADAIDRAIAKTGRVPAAVFSGHAHNYQRFTRRRDDKQVPYIVAGCGGFPGFHQLISTFAVPALTPWPDVTLESYQITRKGFLRMIVTDEQLLGEFFTAPLPPEPESGPTTLADRFLLNWKQNQLLTSNW